MARTVDSNILLPLKGIRAGGWVASDHLNTGWNRIFRNLNTGFEQFRGEIVSDVHPSALLTGTGQTAYYRGKCLGQRGSGATETVEVWLKVRMIETSPSGGACTVTITQGANTSTWSYTPGSDVDPAAYVQASNLTFDDDATFQDIEVEITSASGMTTTAVYNVDLIYKRARTALVAGYYSNINVEPLDLDQAVDNYSMASGLMYQLHNMAKYLYENRVGMIVSSAWPITPHTSSNKLKWFGTAPHGVQNAIFYTRLANASGSLDISSQFGSPTSPPTLATGWIGPWTVPVVSSNPRNATQRNIAFEMDGETSTIESLCGWWDDATYSALNT